MKVVHSGKLKHVQFTFAFGDLFDAEVDAIVSSEQTDFVLARGPRSISGQIWRRYGDLIQQELDEVTKGQVFRPGTVLDTSGGPDFTRIFHAGFHEPDEWPELSGESKDADYFEAIGSCIRQVLNEVRARGIRSVAFPLIGCGLFGLDERMLVLQFLDAIESIDNRLSTDESLNVWLVIRDPTQFQSTVGVFLDLLLRTRTESIALEVDRSGVPMVDWFAARLAERSSQDWAKWLLCRMSEVALGIMCYSLFRGGRPSETPESLFEEARSVTFGMLRKRALECAAKFSVKEHAWGAKFFTGLLKNDATQRALAAINTERNKLAHGHTTLPISEIKRLVVDGLQLHSWPRISESDGELRLVDWVPWVTSSPKSRQAGLFEGWQKNATRYLVPETGEVFLVPGHLQSAARNQTVIAG